MALIEFDKIKPMDIVLIGRAAIDFKSQMKYIVL